MGVKTFESALKKCKKASFDTNVLIYFLEQNKQYYPLVERLFHLAENGDIEFYVSMMLYLESITGYYLVGNVSETTKTKHFLEQYNTIHYLPVDKPIADRAAQMRAQYGFKPPDAIVLATACEYHADTFITNDIQIKKKCKELPILYLKDYL